MTTNPYEMRMQIIENVNLLQQQRYQDEKERFHKGLIPDYPEYPTIEELFGEVDRRIKIIEGTPYGTKKTKG